MMRFVLAATLSLLALQMIIGCTHRDYGVGDSIAEDARNGAAAGAIGGPEIAAITSAAWVIFGVVFRKIEKRRLRNSGMLTDQHAITRKTINPIHSKMPTEKTHLPEPSGEYPQQHIGI